MTFCCSPTITYAPTWEGEDDANNYTSVDRYGPRIVIFWGGVLCGIGWWMTSRATTLGGIDGYYAAMIICGIGAGGVYGTCVGNSLKWFGDRRGT